MVRNPAKLSTMSGLERKDVLVWNELHRMPTLSMKMAYSAMAMNVVIPGSGTMAAAVCNKEK